MVGSCWTYFCLLKIEMMKWLIRDSKDVSEEVVLFATRVILGLAVGYLIAKVFVL